MGHLNVLFFSIEIGFPAIIASDKSEMGLLIGKSRAGGKIKEG